LEIPDPRRLPADALLTGAQVAALLATSKMTIWRLVRRGALAAPVKIGPPVERAPGEPDGRRNYWRAGDLVDFLDGRAAERPTNVGAA
jgi:Helix-turn-helix domain